MNLIARSKQNDFKLHQFYYTNSITQNQKTKKKEKETSNKDKNIGKNLSKHKKKSITQNL